MCVEYILWESSSCHVLIFCNKIGVFVASLFVEGVVEFLLVLEKTEFLMLIISDHSNSTAWTNRMIHPSYFDKTLC